jgi:AraC-like DNA-binding protein
MTDAPTPVFQKPAEAGAPPEPREPGEPRKPYEARGRLDPLGFDRHVQFYTVPPPADLERFIEHFWVIRWDSSLGPYESDQVMHRPYVDIFLSEQDSGIQGTFRGKRTYSAAGSGRIIGVRFRPGAFHAFWAGEMADLQDKMVPLTAVFPWADARGIAAILSHDDDAVIATLLERIRAASPVADGTLEEINAIITAVETQEDLTTVAAVGEAFGRSERWLQQAFRDYLGIGLKWLLQRKRLLAAAAEIRASDEPDWVGIAYDLGYSSQQHFITDFRTVLGATPVQYHKGLTR